MGGNSGVSTTAKRAIGGSASGVSDHKGRFPPILYDMVEETHEDEPDMISWSRDGKSFSISPHHPNLENTIEQYFSRKFFLSILDVDDWMVGIKVENTQ